MTQVFLVDPSARDFRGHFRKQLAAFAAMLAPKERYAIVNRGWSGGNTIGGAQVVPWFRWALTDLARASPKSWRRGVATQPGAVCGRLGCRARCRPARLLRQTAGLERRVARRESVRASGSPGGCPESRAGHRSVYRPELRRLVQSVSLGPGDHVVMPTTDQQILLAVLSLCASIAPDQLPRFHLRFLCDDSCNISGHPSPMSFEDMLRGSTPKRCSTDASSFMRKLRDWLIGSKPSRACVRPWRRIPSAPRRDRPERLESDRCGSAISAKRGARELRPSRRDLASISRRFMCRPGPNVAMFLRSAQSCMPRGRRDWCACSKKPRKVSASSSN